MLRYEILFLTVPEITGDESEEIKSFFSKSIRAAKGDVLSFERWGKYRLAYSVQNNDYGVYFLARFDVALEARDELLKTLKGSFIFKFHNLVMKSMVHRLDRSLPLEYNRPESLEDNPHDVDSFLKKNDMGGLLKKNPARASLEESRPDAEEVEKSEKVDAVEQPAAMETKEQE